MDAQLKKGALDICVLAVLNREELYGYGLKTILQEALDVNENTLYPLLRRLEDDGALETFVKVSEQGRERKYYRLTPLGRERLARDAEAWLRFKGQVDAILSHHKSNQ